MGFASQPPDWGRGRFSKFCYPALLGVEWEKWQCKASLSLRPPITRTHRKEDGTDSSKLAEKGQLLGSLHLHLSLSLIFVPGHQHPLSFTLHEDSPPSPSFQWTEHQIGGGEMKPEVH